MKTMKKISVIVPTLNEEEYIGNLIDSVYAQYYRPVELIFVDGGSSDGTDGIIRRKAEQYNGELFNIKLFYERDFGYLRGTANARNVGADVSSGEYLVYLDADMFFIEADSLDKIAKKLESVNFTKVRTNVAEDTELERQILMDYCKFHFCAYRREVLERVHFNPELCYGEDQDFWYRAKIDAKEVCDVTIGRHLPHTEAELRSQQIWYGRTFLPFLNNALMQKQYIIFFLELKRLLEYCFFLFSPLIIITAFYFSVALGSLMLLLILSIYLIRLLSSREHDLKRLRFLVWSSFFTPYYFIYGILDCVWRENR